MGPAITSTVPWHRNQSAICKDSCVSVKAQWSQKTTQSTTYKVLNLSLLRATYAEFPWVLEDGALLSPFWFGASASKSKYK